MIPYGARIRRQLAGRLLEIGEKDAAVAELKRVHEICVRLGAAPELEALAGKSAKQLRRAREERFLAIGEPLKERRGKG